LSTRRTMGSEEAAKRRGVAATTVAMAARDRMT
jgi:hypothetical protein